MLTCRFLTNLFFYSYSHFTVSLPVNLILILLLILLICRKCHLFRLTPVICLAVALLAASCISPLGGGKRIMRATISNGLCVNALQRRITLINLCINRPLRYVVHARDKKRRTISQVHSVHSPCVGVTYFPKISLD